MIEIRWLNRQMEGQPTHRETVLQVRRMGLLQNASGAIQPDGNGWTDWQDVPTVREE